VVPEEIRFLEGPQTRSFELARAVRIFLEFMRGFRALHYVGPCVTVFGSARFKADHPYYDMARDLGARLARVGFTVLTGGGPANATHLIATYAYQVGVATGLLGEGAAISLFMLPVLFIVVWLQLRYLRRLENA
jgi:hypothetical protein